MAKLKLDRTDSHYGSSPKNFADTFGSSTSGAEQQMVNVEESRNDVRDRKVVRPTLVKPTGKCLICRYRMTAIRVVEDADA